VYTQDAKHIFTGSMDGDATVIDVDRATFHVISETEARDKGRSYFEGDVVSGQN
jgi:hypothetical protein